MRRDTAVRWHDLGLAVLALVTVALTLFMFRAVTDAPTGARPDVPAAAVATTDGPRRTATEDGAVAEGSPSPSGGSGPRAGQGGSHGADDAALAAAREVLDGDESVVVAALGDSTGNETWEWVYGWARLLTQTREVSVVSWNEWTEDGYIEPRVLKGPPSDSRAPVVIYSGHQSGARASYVVEHLDALLPEPPDLVILNFGHNHTAAEVGAELEEALEALRRASGPQVPVVVTLQQPQEGDANAQVRAAVHAFAGDQGLATVDVAQAFEDSGLPLGGLLADPVHPNEAGAVVWAEAVARTLGAP
jgi:hypothetical protein